MILGDPHYSGVSGYISPALGDWSVIGVVLSWGRDVGYGVGVRWSRDGWSRGEWDRGRGSTPAIRELFVVAVVSLVERIVDHGISSRPHCVYRQTKKHTTAGTEHTKRSARNWLVFPCCLLFVREANTHLVFSSPSCSWTL